MIRGLLKRAKGGAARDGAAAGGAPLTLAQRAALEHFPRSTLTPKPQGEQGWEFPAHLDNPSCRWLQALKHVYGQKVTFPASLSPQAGQLLHAIVLNAQPRVVIETGMFLGISTIWIAAALELNARAVGGGELHSVDDFRPIRKGRWRAEEILDGRERRVREHLAMAGLEHRVTIHDADSAAGIAAVGRVLGERGREGGTRGGGEGGKGSKGEGEKGSGGNGAASVQLAFLDADHTPAGVRREFEALEPLLDTGGLIVLHDIYPEISRWRGPRELLDHVHSFARGRYEHVDLYLAPANFGLGVMRRIG